MIDPTTDTTVGKNLTKKEGEQSTQQTDQGSRGALPALTPKNADAQELAAYIYSDTTLEQIGYFDAGYKRRRPTQTAPSKKLALPDGRRFKIVPSMEYGYPNTEDLDFKRGFERIVANRLERRTDYTENGDQVRRPHLQIPVRFSTRELLRETGRHESARDWKAAHEWVKRQTSTSIEGEITFGKNGNRRSTSISHLFLRVVLTGEQMPDGSTADEICVWPEPWFLSRLAYLQTHLLDTTLHRQLGRFSYGKNLLPLLTAGWYASKAAPFRKSYRALCDLFGLTVYKKPSDRERQFDPSHRRLHQLRVLKSWTWEHREDDSILTFHAGRKFHEDQEARSGRRSLAANISDAQGSPRNDETRWVRGKAPTNTQRFSPPTRRPRTGNPYNLTADEVAQAEGMATDAADKLDLHRNRRNFFKLASQSIQGHYAQTFFKVVSEVADAKHRGLIEKSVGAYFEKALKNQAPQLDLLPPTPPTGLPFTVAVPIPADQLEEQREQARKAVADLAARWTASPFPSKPEEEKDSDPAPGKASGGE